MKTSIKTRSFIITLGCITAFSQSVFAASEDECAIWLCLPGGFPSGCGAAKSAMTDRLKKFKPPLPAFTSCVSNHNGSDLSYNYNYAAVINTTPPSYQKGTSCRHIAIGLSIPENCIATVRYIDVLIDGQLAGDTYYWH